MLSLLIPDWPQFGLLCATAVVALACVGLGWLVGARRPAVAMVAGWGVASLVLVGVEAGTGANLRFVVAGLGLLGFAGLAGTSRTPFAPGSWRSAGRVLLLAIPLLSIAAATVPSGIDEYSHWLANLGYLVLNGHLPTLANPNIVSVRPGYPYGLAFVGYAASLISGQRAESAGIIWNILLLLGVATLATDILEAQSRRRGTAHPPCWTIAAICVLFCGLLSPSFVAKLFLSNYGDPAAGSVVGVMTAAMILFLTAEPDTPPANRGQLVAIGSVAAALVNIRQDSASLLPIFLVAALAAAFNERRAGRAVSPWRMLGILPVPLLMIALWRAYQAEQIPNGAFSVLPAAAWHWRELPLTLSHMASIMVAKPGHFGLLLLLVVVAVAAVIRPNRFSPWQRIAAMLGALLGVGKTTSMLVLYLVADFSAGQAAVANSFWRFSIQCGPPLVVAGLTLLPAWMERARRAAPWSTGRTARAVVWLLPLFVFLAPIAGIRQLHDGRSSTHIGYLRRVAADMAPLVDRQPALALIDLDNDPGNLPNLFPIRYEILTGLRSGPQSPVPAIVMLSGDPPRRVVVRGQLPEQHFDGLDAVSRAKFQWFSDGGEKASAIAGIPLARGSSYLVEHTASGPSILRTWPFLSRK